MRRINEEGVPCCRTEKETQEDEGEKKKREKSFCLIRFINSKMPLAKNYVPRTDLKSRPSVVLRFFIGFVQLKNRKNFNF